MKFDPANRPKIGRPLAEIQSDLRKEIPAAMLKHKVVDKKGTSVPFIPWFKVIDILDWFAPGWTQEIRSVNNWGNQAIVVLRITIPAAEGVFFREACGIEDDEVDYGDTSSNASARALKRAAAMFGLGKYLYDKR